MVSKLKDMKRILIIILCFTNLIAFSQSILVNNQSVNVSSDISFPYWLDSTSTLAIDSHVVSISVLEFNITPTTNGNSLVFNQAKTVTSQETVPSGKTWKVESVLLDSSFTQSNNSGTTTVVSGVGGSLRPLALSNESVNTMNFGDAMRYCDSLIEDGYDNWVVPTFEELTFVAAGGGIVPGTRTANILFSRSSAEAGNSANLYDNLQLNDGSKSNTYGYVARHIRCVRHAAVTVSSGGGNSSSGGSGNVVSSGLTPIAISTESSDDFYFPDAMLYCDSLVEDGYDDWILPTIDELTFISSGGLELPDSRTNNYLWSRSPVESNNMYNRVYVLNFLEVIGSNSLSINQTRSSFLVQKYNTRCIRRGAVTVSSSGGGSSSGGSSTPSTLGNGMPTMISNESVNKMVFGNCVLYCDSLSENGHSDWIMPTIDQLTYASSGGCIIPDTRSGDYIWSRSFMQDQDAFIFKLIPPTLNDGYDQIHNKRTHNPSSFGNNTLDPKCRCVR
jgi:hypothetical protein